jgi:predicted transcriptional regulator
VAIFMKDRCRWEIIMDLLKVIKSEGNGKKTKIMHKAYLDWKNFNQYLDFLINEGLIKNNSLEGNTFEITDKGEELLIKLKAVAEILC